MDSRASHICRTGVLLAILIVSAGMLCLPGALHARPALDTLTFTGADPDAHMGYAADGAGDVNGDGYPDMIVSQHAILRADVFFGGPSMDTVADVVLSEPASMFGVAVCGAGDVNGDGFDDVLVAAMAEDDDRGRVFLYLGGAAMDATADLHLCGSAPGDYFGYAVAPAGDLNADGFDDFLVTAPTSNGRTGRAYVYFGGSVPDSVPDVLLYGELPGDMFGVQAGCGGDQNGDGFSDILVSAPDRDDYAGAVYVFHGGLSMDAVPDRVVVGATEGERLGAGVPLRTGDVNGDGRPDLVVGSGEMWSFRGILTVFLASTPPDDVPDLVVHGEADGDGFACGAHSLASGGDLNGDGVNDILVGAPSHSAGGSYAGKAYVFLGGTRLDAAPDRVWFGAAGDRVGNSVALPGDADGNGYGDALVGAADDDESYPPNRGYASLYLLDVWSATRNPGFEEGTAGWSFFTNGAGSFAVTTPGFNSPAAGRVGITGAGSNTQLYQRGIHLEPGMRYRLRLAAYSNRGHDAAVFLHRHDPPATNYGLSGHVLDLTPGWREYAVEFTTSGFRSPVDDARLRIRLSPYASAGDLYVFDDVLLEQLGTALPSVNLVVNPDFEGGEAPWRFFTDGAGSFAAAPPGWSGSRAGQVTVLLPGSNTQVYQTGLNLLPNTRYRLSFGATSTAGSDIVVALQRHDAPYTNYGVHVACDLTPSWQAFTFGFRTTGFTVPVADARLRFSVMSPVAGEVIAIDRVALSLSVARETDGSPIVREDTPGALRLLPNYPNPFNASTEIRFMVPVPAVVSIVIHDALGRRVAELGGEVLDAGSHGLWWDASGLASGVYLARCTAVTAGGGALPSVTQRLLLLK